MSQSQQPSVVELLASTQADLISYQRKHISDLGQTINQLVTERNNLLEQLGALKNTSSKDNMS
jgi:chorismate mutase